MQSGTPKDFLRLTANHDFTWQLSVNHNKVKAEDAGQTRVRITITDTIASHLGRSYDYHIDLQIEYTRRNHQFERKHYGDFLKYVAKHKTKLEEDNRPAIVTVEGDAVASNHTFTLLFDKDLLQPS